MKLVLVNALVKPFKFEEVEEALSNVGIQGMTVTEVLGYSKDRSATAALIGKRVAWEEHKYFHLMVAVPDAKLADGKELVEVVVEGILQAAKTGKRHDGKVWISYLESAHRVRTGETGEYAV